MAEDGPEITRDAPGVSGRVIVALMAAGAVLAAWVAAGPDGGRPGTDWRHVLPQYVGLALVALVLLVPPLSAAVAAALDRWRYPSPQNLLALTAITFIVVAVYLYATAALQGRDLFPKWHDHQMLQLQAQMLSRGRLWGPAHPLADFFDTFYVMVRPVYAAIYFPGTALMYAPGVWAGLDPWVVPLLASAGAAAVFFRVLAELLDAVAAAAGVLWLGGVWVWRDLSVAVMSNQVLMLLALAAVWAWLRWRRGGTFRPGWAAALGAALGWAAITRPLDALAYALPLAVAVLVDLRREPWRGWTPTVIAVAAAAAPFLALQLAQNKGLTGSYARLAINEYAEREMPGYAGVGRSVDAAALAAIRPTSPLPQKQAYFRDFAVPLAREHAGESLPRAVAWRLRKTLLYALPGPARPGFVEDLWPASLLLVLLPVGLAGLGRGRRWVLWAPLPLFVGGYLLYPTLLEHYTVVVAPAVIFGLLLGGKVLSEAWAGTRTRAALSVATALGPAALALGALPELSGWGDDPDVWPTMYYNYARLPREVDQPAVVLFRFRPPASFHEEPVYNIDAARPDDAPVIRAHDLGPRNRQIIEYFAERQPGRTFYRYDRGDGTLKRLGTAAELAATIAPVPATGPATQNSN